MKAALLIVYILFLTAACRSKDGISTGILTQKKMQAVIWDLMRADQFLADYVLNNDTTLDKTRESLKYYQQIFAIHKINKEEFQHSFSFYVSQPALLKAIMDSISNPPLNANTGLAQPQLNNNTDTAKTDTAIKKAPLILRDTGSLRKKNIQFLPDSIR